MITIDGLSNTLSQINLDSSSLENLISNYKLEFPKTRLEQIEWKMRLPMFVPPFYDFIKRTNSIPTQEQYYNYYLSQNQNFFNRVLLSDNLMKGLRGRIYRTYPSLVRDIHFGLTLRNMNIFDDVFYNETLDIEYGIDLVVSRSSNILGLNLYINSKNALFARQVKQYRPKKPVNFNSIEMPIESKGSKLCGKFYLYSDREINQIIQEISKYV